MDAIETTTIEQDGQTYRITVYADPDSPNPLEDWSEMGTILSLNRRHVNFDTASPQAWPPSRPEGPMPPNRRLISIRI